LTRKNTTIFKLTNRITNKRFSEKKVERLGHTSKT